jgi:hypothetical protein
MIRAGASPVSGKRRQTLLWRGVSVLLVRSREPAFFATCQTLKASSRMLDQDLTADRLNHPLDMVERLATLNDWAFDRDGDEEISVIVKGGWTDYQVTVTWLDQMEALHVASTFDLKVPERRKAEIVTLISLINEQLWVGHFDFWTAENVVMFRHSLLLSGGAEATDEQGGTLIKVAVETCERYYQAFQFVLWAGNSAKEALASAMMETVGQA